MKDQGSSSLRLGYPVKRRKQETQISGQEIAEISWVDLWCSRLLVLLSVKMIVVKNRVSKMLKLFTLSRTHTQKT